jgi:hypothetical protein
MIDDSLFDCCVLPQQGCDGATGKDTRVPYPFGINSDGPRSFGRASNRLRMEPLTQGWMLCYPNCINLVCIDAC